jgi:hypothetical protein
MFALDEAYDIGCDTLEADLAAAHEERDRLADENKFLRDALHAHALVCPQHPIGDERRRAEAAHAQIAALREALQACDGNAYTAQLEGEDIEANLRGIQDIARAALSAAPPPAARDALAERVASALGVEG